MYQGSSLGSLYLRDEGSPAFPVLLRFLIVVSKPCTTSTSGNTFKKTQQPVKNLVCSHTERFGPASHFSLVPVRG